MLNKSYKEFFKTLGNENRLEIIFFLKEHGSSNVTNISSKLKLEQTLVSHNLKRLYECHFVSIKKNGRERIYTLNKKTIYPLLSLMNEHINKYCINCHPKKRE